MSTITVSSAAEAARDSLVAHVASIAALEGSDSLWVRVNRTLGDASRWIWSEDVLSGSYSIPGFSEVDFDEVHVNAAWLVSHDTTHVAAYLYRQVALWAVAKQNRRF